VEREDGKAVFVASDGVVQVKPVDVARELGADVYVSSGLTGNESIIIGAELGQLEIGDKVETGQ
jgi:hypothetical protein